jgi:ribosomal protein S18 acetylase RimI-like enzyme
MQSILLSILILFLCVFYLDAFVPSERRRGARSTRSLSGIGSSSSRNFNGVNEDTTINNNIPAILKHKDIVWKLRPSPETSRLKRIWIRIAANLIRFDCLLFRKEKPTVLCPKTDNGQVLLEAYIKDNNNNNKLIKVGRFGFTTERGPRAPQIQDTVQDLYGISNNIIIGVAAIIYMYIEPEYRKNDIGKLALEVIGYIHSIQGCDFTVLVVDDNGSGKLIDWYTKHGYSKAPKIQNIMGSPDGVHGITMIAPTNSKIDQDCQIKWW